MAAFEKLFVELVIFDLDGVLINSDEAIVKAFNRALSEHGLPEAEEQAIISHLGVPSREMIRRISPNATENEQEEMARDFVRIYGETFLPLTRLQPGVHMALKWARTLGKKVALATNKSRNGTDKVLEAFSLGDYFDKTYAVEDVKRNKPDPEVINRALQDLDVQPERAVMVGDTFNDVSAALGAGVACVGVLTGTGTRKGLEEAGARFVIKDLTQLSRVIE